MDQAIAYRDSFERIRSLVDDSNAQTEVPTCPGWSVKDVVGHLADFFAVYKTDPDNGFSPGWADDGVRKRADASIDECVQEVESHLAEPEGVFESRIAQVAVADVLAHEQDIRTALGEPGAQDDPNIVPAIQMGLGFIEQQSAEAELPPLRIVTEDIDQTIGEGASPITLRTSNYELFRTLHGRRTVDQVQAMDWDGDPEPWMSSLFMFGPTQEIVEK